MVCVTPNNREAHKILAQKFKFRRQYYGKTWIFRTFPLFSHYILNNFFSWNSFFNLTERWVIVCVIVPRSIVVSGKFPNFSGKVVFSKLWWRQLRARWISVHVIRWKINLHDFVSLHRISEYEATFRCGILRRLRIRSIQTICIRIDFTVVKRAII